MNYAQIRQYDIANGQGIRTTLFVSGCPFHCEDCFNKEYQQYEYGEFFSCNTADAILSYLKEPTISGISILGGDPLAQSSDDLSELICLIKQVKQLENKDVWLWSGYTWEKIFRSMQAGEFNLSDMYRKELISLVDIFVDGEFKKELKDMRLKFRGSSNQRIIDVQKTLANNGIVLWEENQIN